MRADEAKQNAQDVLLKTNATREKVDRSNEDLRNLIKQIRDFLTGQYWFTSPSDTGVCEILFERQEVLSEL